MINKTKIDERRLIFAIKSIALVSIVAAHSTPINSNSNKLNANFSWLLYQFGSIGVALFFIISGYLYYKSTNRSITLLLRKKTNNILLPWVFTGTIVYLYVHIRNNNISVISWLNFLIGNGSYLYYLTLLFVFYVLFYSKPKKSFVLYFGIIVFLISIILTSIGYLDIINPYLNPFNFLGYFIVGIIMYENNNFIRVVLMCRSKLLYLLVLYFIVLFFMRLNNLESGYWGLLALVVQPLAIMVALGLSTFGIFLSDRIQYYGRLSYSIYLLHMPIAGVLNYFLNTHNLWHITLLRPIIVILITGFCIRLFVILVTKLRIKKYALPLIGIKETIISKVE